MSSSEGDVLTYVDLCGKQVNICEDTPLVTGSITTDSINVFKDVILSTIAKLKDTIDFLKKELEEKKLLIRTLVL